MSVLGWMRPPAPRQVVLARDKLRAEYPLSAVPVPGIDMTMQRTLLSLSGGREGLNFSCAYLFPCSHREARLERSDR